jgi:hypothetical protein
MPEEAEKENISNFKGTALIHVDRNTNGRTDGWTNAQEEGNRRFSRLYKGA